MIDNRQFIIKNTSNSSRLDGAICVKCGLPFHEGDIVVRRGRRERKRYYHSACFEKEFVESHGYWYDHDYFRLNVKDHVETFCGWQPLKELVDYAGSERNKAFLSTLFLTGGRVSEVLALTKQNFEAKEAEGLVIVRGMKLLKRYKKLEETVDTEGRKHWVTEKQTNKTRNPFPIIMREPLTPKLVEWLEGSEGLLFPSPYKSGLPLTRSWAYKLIRRIDAEIPQYLTENLGLKKAHIVEGTEISKKLHLWLHWFRAQRACQLVLDYGYEVIDLIDYFSWEKYETALHYAKKGWKGLATKMLRARASYL